MTVTILSPETHVNIAVVNSSGDIIAWQSQPFFTLADLYPGRVKWMSNRTSLARPGSEDTERNIRVFTGCIYLKLSEEDEQRIKAGDASLIDTPFHVEFTDGSREVYSLNSLWSSATKSQTLTGYVADINADLRQVFNYAESGVRAGRATRGGFANGKVQDWPVQLLPMGELLDTNHGFPLVVGDGEFFIRASDAVALRRALVADPFSLGQWRLSPQVVSQIKHPYDQEGAVLELLPHLAEGLQRINDHSEFITHAFRFGMTEESKEKLLSLAEEMCDHPDLNQSLSPDKARVIFDTITTGRPKNIQGFVAVAGTLEGCAVFPSNQTRFPKSDLYLLARYPVNNSRCIMPVVALQSGPQADFLNEIEQFQGTMFGMMNEEGRTMNEEYGMMNDESDSSFIVHHSSLAVGQFIVLSDEYWPEAYAHVKLIVCSENIKASSTWKTAADVKASKARKELIHYTGYISVCQWAHKGNAVMVDPVVWKEANGDFDFDEGEAIPEVEFPLIFDAFRKEWEITTGLAVSKLPKIYTFDDPQASRAKTLADTLAGAMAVGLAANCNLVILNSDPARWSEVATRIGSDDYFYSQMVAKGYIVESYTDELIAWFAEICRCNSEEATRVIRMFYVLSFFIQCGVDGFKTNLANIGGMGELVKVISKVWKVLTKELKLSQRLIQFNPKKSPTALRDRAHQPEFAPDEPAFGVAESLMKLAIEGFTWDDWPHRLELPDYLYLGNLPDSYKYWAIGPRTQEELEAARLLRQMCREEIARRSMMTPKDWALFAETFWAKLVRDFQANGRIVVRYGRQVKGCRPVYTVAKERTFPTLRGISWERLAHLLWFAFHDTGGKSTGSAIPLFWIKELQEWLFDIIARKPGQVDRQDEFDLVVVGLDKAGIERGLCYLVDVRLERMHEQIKVGKETLTIERSRNVIEFSGDASTYPKGYGRYVMLPKDGPLLGAARFTVVFRREGSRDIGHFERAIPVSAFDLSARLDALKAGVTR